MIRGTGRKKLSNSTGCEVIKTSTQIRKTRKYALNQTRYTSTRNSPTIFAIRTCCGNQATPNQRREKAARKIAKVNKTKDPLQLILKEEIQLILKEEITSNFRPSYEVETRLLPHDLSCASGFR